jgi:hypothetical protein
VGENWIFDDSILLADSGIVKICGGTCALPSAAKRKKAVQASRRVSAAKPDPIRLEIVFQGSKAHCRRKKASAAAKSPARAQKRGKLGSAIDSSVVSPNRSIIGEPIDGEIGQCMSHSPSQASSACASKTSYLAAKSLRINPFGCYGILLPLAAELRLPFVECRRTDPVLAAELRRPMPCSCSARIAMILSSVNLDCQKIR